jgi:hypothetical protein
MIEPILAYVLTYLVPLKPFAAPIYSALGAVLNRVRGGGYLPEFGTAKKMWLIATIFTGMAALLYPLHLAIAIGLSYVVWDVALPWGRWYTHNRHPRTISADYTWPERLIEMISDIGGTRRDRVAFFIRNLVAFTGAAVVLSFGLIDPSLVVLAVTSGQIAPLLVAFSAIHPALFYFVPVMALLQSLAYEIGWRLADHIEGPGNSAGIHYSEHLHGAVWGAVIGIWSLPQVNGLFTLFL